MKIGLLLPSVYMGTKYRDKIFAPKELLLNLADELVKRGNEVYVYGAPGTKTRAHLISGDEDLIKKDFTDPKYRGLDRLSKLKNAHTATKIEYEIGLTVKAYMHAREKKLDIMHSFHDFMAHYIDLIDPLKTVYTLHDPKPLRDHLGYWRFRHFKNDDYIFISESQLKNYHKMVRSVGVIYHGVNTKKFEFKETEGEYLAFLGRYIKEKGVLDGIKAAKESHLTLKMIGDDAYRELPFFQKEILPHLKKGVVEDESFFGEGDRGPFLRNAKALLFPIQWEEPFGMVMIEAMACGTPVVAYNHGSVSEIVEDGVTGFIVDQDDANRPNKGKWIIKKQGVEGLVEAIKRIGEIDRAACRQLVESKFTVEKMAENYEKVYKKVLGV
jgi:glycosyltransferase involved in cell wall biosynthesis